MSSRILSDLGHGNLEQRIEALHKVTEAENTVIKVYTEEEAFVKLATRDKNMHTKAKLIILQLLNQISQGLKPKIPN
jgi:hypothetical protein